MASPTWLYSVLSGLAGGVLASGITIVYSSFSERKRERQARTANSFSLISALEAYAINCEAYIGDADDALDRTINTGDRTSLSRLRTPKFEIPPSVDFRPI